MSENQNANLFTIEEIRLHFENFLLFPAKFCRYNKKTLKYVQFFDDKFALLNDFLMKIFETVPWPGPPRGDPLTSLLPGKKISPSSDCATLCYPS